MSSFKYQKQGSSTYYGLSTLKKRFAKQYEALGKDDGKFEKWLYEVKGYRCYYM